ncbi:LuxR C-terminal-related transcriptional regulator [Nocardioides sp. QY071]|uniref:helix-turn-helix transcriptional regulator n=1 Tax=Nocardioides sp. QY071 TaxID=3044187 RepID=UPI00249BD7A9|nr:LuxR C-terminal-related transcriptional regulator [Nocardioides sp. QY071]WGY03992.1 LuxR C-terminal-related transcriptional regulator [Nocardioides sp. QY071]
MARPIRMTILDYHLLFAESVGAAFESDGYLVAHLDLHGPRTSLAGALAAVLRSAPRLVLLELDLGELGDGIRLVAPLTSAGVAVVVLTGNREPARWGECLRHGAKTVISKSCTLDEMRRTVRRVRDGLPAMPLSERAALIEAASRENEELRELRSRLERLTPRETEILAALMTGAQVSDIAKAHVVAVATVRTQVKTILAKMETTSQLAAVGAAYRANWRPLLDARTQIQEAQARLLVG